MGNGPSGGPSVDGENFINVAVTDANGTKQTIKFKLTADSKILLGELMDVLKRHPDFMDTLENLYDLNSDALEDAKRIQVMYHGEPTPVGELVDKAVGEVSRIVDTIPEITFTIGRLKTIRRR